MQYDIGLVISPHAQNIFIPATAFSEAIRPVNYISAIGVTVEQSNTKWIEERI